MGGGVRADRLIHGGRARKCSSRWGPVANPDARANSDPRADRDDVSTSDPDANDRFGSVTNRGSTT